MPPSGQCQIVAAQRKLQLRSRWSSSLAGRQQRLHRSREVNVDYPPGRHGPFVSFPTGSSTTVNLLLQANCAARDAWQGRLGSHCGFPSNAAETWRSRSYDGRRLPPPQRASNTPQPREAAFPGSSRDGHAYCQPPLNCCGFPPSCADDAGLQAGPPSPPYIATHPRRVNTRSWAKGIRWGTPHTLLRPLNPTNNPNSPNCYTKNDHQALHPRPRLHRPQPHRQLAPAVRRLRQHARLLRSHARSLVSM